ncbi:queuosine precursor transporter [Cytobacillus firmus]|uniref:queuosine precursor transporter n=1 Tax=Cytobacillus firmus TaxID=1399 RepID=UPI00077C15D1|nr:queuosine precursor transporter [Cytobacillus firmus]MBG9542991.1 membrane protein [Cytobacillus firmus]MBG9546585.1 membrane protein [Cytobacillus firmus]MBG9552865.1 membrane protein [Cytobacillus firmus]MBG9556984.1 membrane protein [Cytobacillus firmus]MBG9576447.1 membrane protein [Cytobacillus firmus]
MFNEWFGLLFAIINFILVLAMYRLFGKTGLFVWIGFSTVMANLQVVKTIEMFGLTATLGNAMYGTAFLVTDILNEKYGKEEAKKAVWLGFFTLLSMTLIMQMVLLFKPHETDFAQESLSTLFSVLPRIAAGSLAAYLVSQFTDVYIFTYLKKKFPKDGQFWIRNNGSTMISQLLDSLVFTSIAFLGVFSLEEWIQIFITTYLLKFIVAVLDTPFGYIAKRFPVKD